MTATIGGRRRCQTVSRGEQCRKPLARGKAHPGAHTYRRHELARHRATVLDQMAALATEGGERGAFWADLLADAQARDAAK